MIETVFVLQNDITLAICDNSNSLGDTKPPGEVDSPTGSGATKNDSLNVGSETSSEGHIVAEVSSNEHLVQQAEVASSTLSDESCEKDILQTSNTTG